MRVVDIKDAQREIDRLTAENRRLQEIVTEPCRAVRELDARTATMAGAEQIAALVYVREST